MGGSAATVCTAATTVTGAGTAGAIVVDGVVGIDAAAGGVAAGGVVVALTAALVVALGVVRAGTGVEDGTDDARWGLRAMTVVTARVAARHAAARRTSRGLPSRDVRLILRLMRSARPVADAPSAAGEDGGMVSTMC
jgi:hypothetical protein